MMNNIIKSKYPTANEKESRKKNINFNNLFFFWKILGKIRESCIKIARRS